MSPRILIVEDDPTSGMALLDTLEEASFEVFEACNGKEALLQLMHRDIDIIVSDVQMDVMDGNELLRVAREVPFHPICHDDCPRECRACCSCNARWRY